MYIAGFASFFLLGKYRAASQKKPWTDIEILDLVFYGAIASVIGGRLGYTCFYNFDNFMDDPLSLFRLWEGGMSFHGGLIGGALAITYMARATQRTFFQVQKDLVAWKI